MYLSNSSAAVSDSSVPGVDGTNIINELSSNLIRNLGSPSDSLYLYFAVASFYIPPSACNGKTLGAFRNVS